LIRNIPSKREPLVYEIAADDDPAIQVRRGN
jgi:hypothetical protein